MYKEFGLVIIADLQSCNGDILSKISSFCKNGADTIVLRAKNLDEKEYEKLAQKAKNICEEHGKEFVINGFMGAALNLGVGSFWLTSSLLNTAIKSADLANFTKIYAPAHDINEAKVSASLGANVLVASHIFKTPCKAGLLPKGINFIKALKQEFGLEIFGLGGINSGNFNEVLSSGASGICLMSDAMKSDDSAKFMSGFGRV